MFVRWIIQLIFRPVFVIILQFLGQRPFWYTRRRVWSVVHWVWWTKLHRASSSIRWLCVWLIILGGSLFPLSPQGRYQSTTCGWFHIICSSSNTIRQTVAKPAFHLFMSGVRLLALSLLPHFFNEALLGPLKIVSYLSCCNKFLWRKTFEKRLFSFLILVTRRQWAV